jgi:hypothetical protein
MKQLKAEIKTLKKTTENLKTTPQIKQIKTSTNCPSNDKSTKALQSTNAAYYTPCQPKRLPQTFFDALFTNE